VNADGSELLADVMKPVDHLETALSTTTDAHYDQPPPSGNFPQTHTTPVRSQQHPIWIEHSGILNESPHGRRKVTTRIETQVQYNVSNMIMQFAHHDGRNPQRDAAATFMVDTRRPANATTAPYALDSQ